MRCIYCAHKTTEVVNSREGKKGSTTWRRRMCLGCNRVFTTTESGRADNLFVIKSNNRRQRFLYEKLFASIFSVFSTLKHRDNGDNALVSKQISEKVIQSILSTTVGKDVKTKTIIALVFKELKKVTPSLSSHYIYYSDFRRRVGVEAKLV